MTADVDEHKRELDQRLSRVEGQLRGIRRMIETDQDCEQIAQQMAAARRALDRAFYRMMACVMERELLPDEAQAAPARRRLAELGELLVKFS